MIGPRIQVRIGGKTLKVPVYRDRRTTLRIVKRLNERLAEIEKESPRIDTQAFALEAALSFAAELDEAEESRDADSTELFNDLDVLSSTLDNLLNEYRSHGNQPPLSL